MNSNAKVVPVIKTDVGAYSIVKVTERGITIKENPILYARTLFVRVRLRKKVIWLDIFETNIRKIWPN